MVVLGSTPCCASRSSSPYGHFMRHIRNIKAFLGGFLFLSRSQCGGIEILPVIFVIDLVLAVKGVYRRRTFVVQAIILVIAFCFCLQGLRQSPPPPPESGITVRGACRTVLPRLASLDGKAGDPFVEFVVGSRSFGPTGYSRPARTTCARRATISSPIASDAVAPGLGAFRTCTALACSTKWKSCTNSPCGVMAWARTPVPPVSRSDAWISGTRRCSDWANRRLLNERSISSQHMRV